MNHEILIETEVDGAEPYAGLLRRVIPAALEAEGYLYAEPGKGAFAARSGAGENPRRAELLRQFDAAANELKFLGMTARELADRVSGAETMREEEAQ